MAGTSEVNNEENQEAQDDDGGHSDADSETGFGTGSHGSFV